MNANPLTLSKTETYLSPAHHGVRESSEKYFPEGQLRQNSLPVSTAFTASE